MNPDKLFNYLDGKLSPTEREAFEDQLIRDPELQKEFAMARRIHDRMSGEGREVLLDEPSSGAARGRQIMRRVTIVFLTLIFLNTLIGLIVIGLLESKRRNAKATEQNRADVTRALQHAAANALPTPSLDVDEIKITVPPKQQHAMVDKVNAVAQQAGGSAAKNLSNENGTLIFVEIPAAHLSEFRQAMSGLGATLPPSTTPSPAGGNAILQVRIVDRAE